MKSVIKLALVFFLFTSAAFAEGDLGTGSRTCPNGQTTCVVASDPEANEETTSTESENTVITVIQEYFEAVFGYFENQL